MTQMPTMRKLTISLMALIALTACGRKGARRSDFDSATAAALATGPASELAGMPKLPHVASLNLGHGLDRHNMIFGGVAQQFHPGDSVLVSVKGQYLPDSASVGARIRFKNATLDSVATKAGTADTAGFTYVGLRFASGVKWVKGAYLVEVFINGKFQVAADFTVGQ